MKWRLDPRRISHYSIHPHLIAGGVFSSKSVARTTGGTLPYSRQCRVIAGPNITNVSPPSNRKRSIDRSIVFCQLYVCSTYNTHNIQLLLPISDNRCFRFYIISFAAPVDLILLYPRHTTGIVRGQ